MPEGPRLHARQFGQRVKPAVVVGLHHREVADRAKSFRKKEHELRAEAAGLDNRIDEARDRQENGVLLNNTAPGHRPQVRAPERPRGRTMGLPLVRARRRLPGKRRHGRKGDHNIGAFV